ncbi:MAG: hypothetical protein HXY34_10575 [Candidatus Thorarchaeota archaeon]|nr:hypothetical protein [Candidatus Thorarchaeota archaeon]
MDENWQPVLLVYWGDAWVGSQKAWFNTYFYPQGGGSYYQQSGYIYTSFLKTGKLWWADGGSLSPQGVIYSTIDGQGGGLPIAAVDNASRVIKYVVILGYRYQSYSLVDMRVQGINVVADFNRHDQNSPSPTEPVESDGTANGAAECHGGAQALFEAKLGEAANMVSLYWTGWWPTLHFVVQRELMTDVVISIHLAVDILGNVEIEAFNVEFLGIQDMTEGEADDMVGRVRPLSHSTVGTGSPSGYFLGIGGAMYTAARIIAAFTPPASAHLEGLFMGMLGLATALIVTGLILLAQAVAQNTTDPFQAAFTFIGAALAAILAIAVCKQAVDSWGGKSTGAAKYFRFWGELYQNGNCWDRIGLKGRTHWMVMFTQMMILVVVILIGVGFLAGWICDVFF